MTPSCPLFLYLGEKVAGKWRVSFRAGLVEKFVLPALRTEEKRGYLLNPWAAKTPRDLPSRRVFSLRTTVEIHRMVEVKVEVIRVPAGRSAVVWPWEIDLKNRMTNFQRKLTEDSASSRSCSVAEPGDGFGALRKSLVVKVFMRSGKFIVRSSRASTSLARFS